MVSGCRNDEFTLERLDPGAECPNGGVRLTVPGKAPQVVCDGANGANGTNGTNGTDGTDGTNGANGDAGVSGTNGQQSLVRQVTIAPGDVRCPTGGVEVQSGLDTSNDGTLDAGEVTSRTVVCNGNTGAVLGSTTPPAGDAGTATIKVNGGLGTATGSLGGNAGSVALTIASGSNGGHLKVWTTGRVDATQVVPTVPAVDPGALLLDVTADLTVEVTSDPFSLDAGTFYVSGGGLFRTTGPSSQPRPVTSLRVASGATLTLPSSGYTFSSGCRVEGTLSFVAGQSSSASVSCADLGFAASSQVRAAGVSSLQFSTFGGDLVARGTMDLSGNTNGGPASLDLRAAQSLYAVGTIRTNGSAVSPNAASIRFGAGNDIVLAGTIEARGADVAWTTLSATGGAGGQLTVDQYYPFTFGRLGEFRSTATIALQGGNVTGDLATCASYCLGGSGGFFSASAATAFLDGSIDVRGGTAYLGGAGGRVDVSIAPSATPANALSSLLSSASLDASGGDGATGGTGGQVNLTLANPSAGGELVLLGYAAIEANGRFGNQGGGGGLISLSQRSASGETTGAVINTVPLSAVGGEGSNSVGGGGGNITLETVVYSAKPFVTWETVTNSGALTFTGGRGTSGGMGGNVSLNGFFGVTSTGTITGTGGAGTTSGGGRGGDVSLRSTRGEVINSTGITVSGGVSGGGPAPIPGQAGFIDMLAEHVSNAGGLVARGGAADPTTGTGGPGGVVRLSSQVTPTTITAPKPAGIDVRGGAAATAGVAGLVMIDGFLDTRGWTF